MTMTCRFVRALNTFIVVLAARQLYAQPSRLSRADVVRTLSRQSAQPQTAIPGPKATGTFITFNAPGDVLGTTVLEGINPRGDIVGGYYDSSSTWQNFLLSKNGTVRNINPPGATPFGWAGGWMATEMGINSQGDIVASYSGSTGLGLTQ